MDCLQANGKLLMKMVIKFTINTLCSEMGLFAWMEQQAVPLVEAPALGMGACDSGLMQQFALKSEELGNILPYRRE